ncbi:MAG TPA: hypothetical protein VFN36_04900 [Solirubrobacteraceae bacterium]|nr:hypothetical protein [Solirubrobacteraceae bacterium]
MMAEASESSPVAVFGDRDADVWGIVRGGNRPVAAVAGLAEADAQLRPAELDTAEDDVWTLLAPGWDLRLERAAAETTTESPEPRLLPCRVSGSAEIGGRRREFDVGGVRGTLGHAGIESLRLFAAWFPAGHALGLISVRAPGAKGHDRDRLEVVARGEAHPLVVDPRLSTTYGADGTPRRVGVELWLGDDAEGDLWPRRVAGAATGSSVEGPGFSAHALECISRGELGAGVYVLAHP